MYTELTHLAFRRISDSVMLVGRLFVRRIDQPTSDTQKKHHNRQQAITILIEKKTGIHRLKQTLIIIKCAVVRVHLIFPRSMLSAVGKLTTVIKIIDLAYDFVHFANILFPSFHLSYCHFSYIYCTIFVCRLILNVIRLR